MRAGTDVRPDAADVRPRGFRARLASETRGAHEATERDFVAIEADPAAALPDFLAASRLAMRALSAARDGRPVDEEADILDRLVDALEHDCRSSGQASLPDLPCPEPLDTLAVGYLVLGSRLGTEVLSRRTRAAGIALPRSFTISMPKGTWRAFCARLDGIDPDGPCADRIVSDARRGFDLHRAAAARVRSQTKDRRP